MDSRNLETLLWVVRLGGIGAAARHLNLTQPAVTRRIQELEREIGGKVMRRQGRNVMASDLGRACLASAERILAEVAAMRAVANGGTTFDAMKVGVVESIALTWFENFLSRIEERYPTARLEIDVDLSSRLVAKLGRGQIDIALVPGPVAIPRVVRASLGQSDLRWLGDARYRPGERMLTPEELAKLPIIGLPQDADTYRSMAGWFEEAQIKPERVHSCNSFSVVALLLRRGVGVSLLQPDLFSRELSAGTLKIITDLPPSEKVEYSAAYLPNVRLPILPEIATLAQEESWFMGTSRVRFKGFTTANLIASKQNALD